MIKLENTKVGGWEAAIRGMRNPMNSWEKSDSLFYSSHVLYNCFGDAIFSKNKNGVYLYALPIEIPKEKDETFKHWSFMMKDVDNGELDKKAFGWGNFHEGGFKIGPNDLDLMKGLVAGGPVHAKFRRMIVVTVDITAPLYWWKEFDTYKVGTVANSCSTMHKIQAKEFVPGDFSCEHLIDINEMNAMTENKPSLIVDFSDEKHPHAMYEICPKGILIEVIDMLNRARELFLKTGDKKYWWQMIQLLPSSYNQKRTVLLNYEVLAGLYPMRKDHKLDEWHDFCHWIERLPYAKEVIIGGEYEP